MPSWKDYKSIAKSRGALAHELFVVFSVAKPDADIPSVLGDHLAYQAQLEAANHLAFAGPLSDDAGEENSGDGLIVYRAQSLDEARAIANADPMHASGTRSYTLRRWLVNEGSFTLNIGLSGNRIGFD